MDWSYLEGFRVARVFDTGDMNADDQVDGLDVDPFVHAVIFEPFNLNADMNGDGAVTGLDVDPIFETNSCETPARKTSKNRLK